MTDIRQYMEAEGCGLIEAKRAVLKLNKIERLEVLRSMCSHDCSSHSLRLILSDVISELIQDSIA